MAQKPIQEGAQIPDVIFKTRVRDVTIGGENPFRWQDVRSVDLFKGKRVVAFAVPGAFTPVCDSLHLPSYEAHFEEFKELGIDEIYCLAVNDAFVMKRWADSLGIESVKMVPDGNTWFTRGMGLLVKKENVGYGERSWRYSMLVEDCVIKKLFIEPGISDNAPEDPYEVSDADTMLDYLKSE